MKSLKRNPGQFIQYTEIKKSLSHKLFESMRVFRRSINMYLMYFYITVLFCICCWLLLETGKWGKWNFGRTQQGRSCVVMSCMVLLSCSWMPCSVLLLRGLPLGAQYALVYNHVCNLQDQCKPNIATVWDSALKTPYSVLNWFMLVLLTACNLERPILFLLL